MLGRQSLFPEIKRKIGQRLSIQPYRTTACNIYGEQTGSSRYAKSLRDSVPDSLLYLKVNYWKKFVIGQILKDYLYTKMVGRL